MVTHTYKIELEWTGNNGSGTSSYRDYARNHLIRATGKPDIQGSSDPVFRGDAGKYNPEEMLLAALSACHMLWYLHLCAEAGVIVTAYADSAHGRLQMNDNGSGQFSEVELMPVVEVQHESMIEKAQQLHHNAHDMCFISRSVNFPVHIRPQASTLQI